jgi:hypothetical protein
MKSNVNSINNSFDVNFMLACSGLLAAMAFRDQMHRSAVQSASSTLTLMAPSSSGTYPFRRLFEGIIPFGVCLCDMHAWFGEPGLERHAEK